ncbi:MAG: hypothetical protein HYR66_06455 [Sphingobacteriales bacterium]|nr:hypothetical protein [Sphingobacteriales bacterium]MBI3720259.1 hypothetical protein [Sphingobacteriales bacterium]
MKSLKQFKNGPLYLLFSTLLFAPSLVKAHDDGDYKVEKKKNYTKSYPVTGSTKVELENSFGEMKIITWDKSEVKVDVDVTVKANSEERAKDILDNIKFEDGKEGNSVYFRTSMNDKKGNWKNKNKNNNDNDDGDDDDDDDKNDKGKHKNYNNTSMEINMTVYMPAGNPIEAINSFGSMIVPDLTGEAEIASKFGSLKCGKISNNKELSVEFGKGDIKHVNGGEVTIKFSSADIDKLSGDVKATFEFSKGSTINLDNTLKGLKLYNSYSTVELELAKDMSAEFDIKTSFGDFKNHSGAKISEEKDDDDEHGPKFDHKYSGKIGNGDVKIKIKSSFGTTKIS